MTIKELCGWCEAELMEGEIGAPRLAFDDKKMCDECYHDKHEFNCYKCGNSDDSEEKDAIGRLLIIADADEIGEGWQTGVYRIVAHPYYTSNMFDMWFHRDALNRVCDLPDGFNPQDECPSGHLCRECTAGIEAALDAAKEKA